MTLRPVSAGWTAESWRRADRENILYKRLTQVCLENHALEIFLEFDPSPGNAAQTGGVRGFIGAVEVKGLTGVTFNKNVSGGEDTEGRSGQRHTCVVCTRKSRQSTGIPVNNPEKKQETRPHQRTREKSRGGKREWRQQEIRSGKTR